jgi:hypothetical protein
MNTLRQKTEARIAQSRDPYSNGNVSLAKAYHAGEVSTLEWVLSLLEQEQQDGWISVKEYIDLIQPTEECLMYSKSQGALKGYYRRYGQYQVWYQISTHDEYNDFEIEDVTHWRQLPQPPKQ